MAINFSDIHSAIIDEAKFGIPFPYKSINDNTNETPKEDNSQFKQIKVKQSRKKVIKIKRDISSEKIKDLVLSRKKYGCSICGYSKCMAALEFHHINPSEKSFAISKAHSGYSLDEILKELEKCILVCSNCHKEIHAGIIKLK